MQFSFHPYGLIDILLILLVPVAALAFVAVVIWFVARNAARRREALNRERLAALERGIPLPPEAFFEHRSRRVGNTLKAGMVELAVGAGIVIMGLLGSPNSRFAGAGIVVILLGVAHIIYWAVRGRREWEEARAADLELARAQAAALASAEKHGNGASQ